LKIRKGKKIIKIMIIIKVLNKILHQRKNSLEVGQEKHHYPSFMNIVKKMVGANLH